MPITDPLFLSLLALIIVVFIFSAWAIYRPNVTRDTPEGPSSTLPRDSVIYHSASYAQTEEDIEFERIFDEHFSALAEEAHYTKVAGTKHRNSDGTSRTAAIRKCQMFDELELIHEPDNPYDSNAIRIIHKKTSSQLGYVEARQASEIIAACKRGASFYALFRKPTLHPETNRIVGAVYLLIRAKREES